MLVRLLFIWVFLLSSAAFASGEGMYIHTDGLGSPVARTNAQGQLISRTRYEPYGATAAGATPTIGFTGHVNDPDTGLIYMQQRYYDPYAGRFLSTDPVLTDANTGGGFNRYVYAKNNPYKYIDPDGRSDVCAGLSRMNCGEIGPGRDVADKMSLPKYDPKAVNFHSYEYSTDLCDLAEKGCSAQYALKSLSYGAAPGQKGATNPGEARRIGILGGNHIIQFADKTKPVIINITQGDHILKDGFVVRYITTGDGKLQVRTYGEGVNTNVATKYLNYAAGYVFKYSDWNMRSQLQLNIRETPQ